MLKDVEFIRTLATTGAEADAAALRQRVAKMDALEAGFERVVARACESVFVHCC